jgi:hypothetical protein
MRWLAVAILATMLVIAPWVGYNLARFRHPVYLSAQYPSLLASANCDATYDGPLLGYFSMQCAASAARREHIGGDQSQQGVGFQRAATDYIRHHLGRLSVVIAARMGRIAEVYRPQQNLSLREYLDDVERPVAHAALFSFYGLAFLAIGGFVFLRRRRVAVYPLLALPALVLITVAVTYSNERFRAPAEVALAVLGAAAVEATILVFDSRRARRTVQQPAEDADAQVPKGPSDR